MARAVAGSFLQQHTDYSFFIGLIDVHDQKLANWYQGYRIVNVQDIGIGHLDEMTRQYNISELSCALKSYFCDYFIRTEPNASEILYLDSDLYVYSPLKEIEQLHQQYDILLTPHLIRPMHFDGKQPDEVAYLATGTYNGGFFSFKVNDNSKAFIKWWCERMRYYCYYKLEEGLFVDQKWMNLIPVFFDKVWIIKHAGYNVSYWNLHERNITQRGNEFFVNDEYPLVFFHYSSINLKDAILFFKQQNRFTDESQPIAKKLFLEYRNEVYREGYETTHRIQSHFSTVYQEHTTATLKKTFKGRLKLWVKKNVPASTRNKFKGRMKGLLGS